MGKRLVIVSVFGLSACIFGLLGTADSQPPGQRRPPGSRGADSLDQTFEGVTTDGNIIPGLFEVRAIGVSTEPVRKAAEEFLAALDDRQREKTQFPIDDLEWRMWDNRHFAARQGVGFEEMSEKQHSLAFAMIGAGLSAKGLKKTQDIMKLNGTLAELTGDFHAYGHQLYWLTIMGEPSATEPWGWQLDGHHVVVNYFVLGDQVVMTPVFMGSEPVRADSGRFQGTVVMQEEQEKGLKFIRSLNEEQLTQAVVQGAKGSTNNLSEAYRDNLVLDYAGIAASELDPDQRQLLLDVIAEYVQNMRGEHATVTMQSIKEHWDRTFFAWIGKTDTDSVFYYRVHSPVILIEFDHQRPIALARSSTPTRNHIHTMVRTPNGNDYGKDLLRQHYLQHSHDGSSHRHDTE